MTTSSTESEYVSLSEIIKEILFIKEIFEFMKIKLQLPIKVNVDNKGESSFLKTPLLKEPRTSIQDTFIRQYIKDGIIEIEFVQTDKNKSDIMTKNFSKDKNKLKFDDVVKEVNQEQG